MDISFIEGNSIRLKGRKATFIVDPAKQMPKAAADAVIVLDGMKNIDVSRVTDSRITITGPGEYEIGGIKVSGTKTPKGTIYRFSMDDMSVFLGFATDVKIEGFNLCQIAIVNTANDFSESFVMALEPKLTILYGDKKNESAKTLGANVAQVSKIAITKDKLPEKTEVAVLG